MIEPDKKITVQKLITDIAHKLCERYCNESLCNQYAWWVLEALTQKSKSSLIVNRDIILTKNQINILHTWIEQQVKEYIPIQYLIGTVPFAECEIIIEPPIPLPRPETEEWVLNSISLLKKSQITPQRILDLGTGSGCIAISLAKAFPQTEIVATDISNESLSLAQKNAEHNNVSITFMHADLFNDFPPELQFDLIISNPPYVSPQEWKEVDPSVRNWENNIAHVAPENGLGILKQIIMQAESYLSVNRALEKSNIPNLLVEIGYKQAPPVKKLFEEAGYDHILIQQDLFGNDRLVSGYIDASKKRNL